MQALSSVVIVLSAITMRITADTTLPRGVGPEFAKYYKSSTSFTCVSAPLVIIPASQVNDDYCDCPDGSDEPGTSACSYLSDLSPSSPSGVSSDGSNLSISLPGFYCKNQGHRPSYISFINVNDGVCDYDLCCDGSDEWARVGGTICDNRCKEIGKEWRKHHDQRQKSLNNASKRRKELAIDARRRRTEVEERVVTLKTEIEGSLLKVADLEAALQEAEKQERGRVVKNPGKASKLNVLVALARDRIEELRTTLNNIRQQRDEGRERLAELEAILATFKEEYNPNFNDEGVKRAVRNYEEYAARIKPSVSDSIIDTDLDEIGKSDEESGGIKWSEWEDEENDVDVLYQIEEYLPKAVREWVDRQLRALRVLLMDNGILAASPEGGSESKRVTDARNELRAAEDFLNDNRHHLKEREDDLNKDYGPDDIFRALKDQCISTDSGEYNYELCWLDRTKQKSRKGGGETNMGNFVRLDMVTVDEDVPVDGKGLGSGERVALRYENGQHCWNGPNRSTLVILACAEKDEIWKVVEEEKCVYRMEVGTAAVCVPTGKEVARDEL